MNSPVCPTCPALWAGPGADETPVNALLSAAARKEVVPVHIRSTAQAQQVVWPAFFALLQPSLHLHMGQKGLDALLKNT